MFKRLFSFIIAFVIVFIFSTTAVYASNFYNENNHINIDNTNKHITSTSTSLSNKNEVILTRYRNGTIKQKTSSKLMLLHSVPT